MRRTLNVLAWIAACAAAVALGTRLALPSNDRPAVDDLPATRSQPAATGPVASFLPALPAGPAVGWGSKPRAPLDAMRAAYRRTPRLDEVFERGLRSPDAGGLFYARLALRYCGVLRGSSPAADAGPDVALLERARARCGTLGDAASRERLDTTMQTSTSRLDPALSIAADLDERLRGDRLHGPEVAAAMDAAVALGDPYVLRNVFLRGLSRVDRFDGEPIDASRRGDLMMASRLALCDLGIDCAQEARVLLTCGSRDGCAQPLVAMGVGDASMSDERRRALDALSLRIVSAAQDGSLAGLFR